MGQLWKDTSRYLWDLYKIQYVLITLTYFHKLFGKFPYSVKGNIIAINWFQEISRWLILLIFIVEESINWLKIQKLAKILLFLIRSLHTHKIFGLRSSKIFVQDSRNFGEPRHGLFIILSFFLQSTNIFTFLEEAEVKFCFKIPIRNLFSSFFLI